MIFDSWQDLGRIVIVGTLAYISLILLLRISGKRTLSKLNAFDLVVTVALGSILASSLLSTEVSVSETVVAFGLLIALQFLIAKTSVHFTAFRHLIKAEPSLLFYRGEYLDSVLRTQRVTRDEIRGKVREMGWTDLQEVEAVVLETDGSISVVSRPAASGASSLEDVSRQIALHGRPDPPR